MLIGAMMTQAIHCLWSHFAAMFDQAKHTNAYGYVTTIVKAIEDHSEGRER